MNADMILVRASRGSLLAAVNRIAPTLGSEARVSLPEPPFPSRPDIRRHKKRTLLVVEGGDDLAVILEGGEVADEVLARALSREPDAEAVVVGLYETVNAWGRRRYARGVVEDELFQPVDAFTSAGGDADWDGDATEACLGWLKTSNWPDGILLFANVIRGELPRGISPTAVTKIALEG